MKISDDSVLKDRLTKLRQLEELVQSHETVKAKLRSVTRMVREARIKKAKLKLEMTKKRCEVDRILNSFKIAVLYYHT